MWLVIRLIWGGAFKIKNKHQQREREEKMQRLSAKYFYGFYHRKLDTLTLTIQ